MSLRTLFLIDGIGALASALALGLVLPTFASAFGMPKRFLYLLSATAACFALYSLWCHRYAKSGRAPLLRGIAIANAAYCMFTLGLLVMFREQLTALGKLYFGGEIAVILCLVFIEARAIRRGAS
ncbi:MAG: hypothetical protein KA712_24360 [Myxococcales bacterium]|nr:hypothetical protein [Myxococcales bacterium]